MTQAEFVVTGVCIIILSLFGFEQYIKNVDSTLGIPLAKLQAQIAQLDAANTDLRLQIITEESYKTIESKALRQGFTLTKNIVTLK